jgi:hypothetical protein
MCTKIQVLAVPTRWRCELRRLRDIIQLAILAKELRYRFQLGERGLRLTQDLNTFWDHQLDGELFHCGHELRRPYMDLQEGSCDDTSFQTQLIPLTPADSIVVYRTRTPRRQVAHESSTPQRLLFEVVQMS